MNGFKKTKLDLFRSHYLALICRLGLGIVFVVAGWSKIEHQSEMIQTVSGYNILPVDLVRPFALTLPWIEFISGVLLITGLMITSASALLVFVNLAFLIAVGTNLLRGTAIDCGCFGPGEQLSWEVFARDLALLLMSLQVLFARSGPLSLDWWLPRTFGAFRRR